MRRSLCPSLLLVALSVLALDFRADAQAIPTVTGAPQLFVQRGQTVDVTVEGKALASVESLALVHPRGLHITLVPPVSGKPVNGRLRLEVSADADAVLGDREFRLIGPAGVSAPLRVIVGQYPEFVEKEPNDTPEQAQTVVFPVSLAGKIQTAGDIDCFRFAASKGQSLIFDVHAARASSALDPLLTVHNEAGRELATTIDQHGGDPVVLFKVPADGWFILSIRDLQYRGGADYTYHIDAGPIPYVQSILPMSAQPGKLSQVTPLGLNLVGVGSIPLDLTYAAEGDISVRAQASAGLSNAMTLAVDELPVLVDEKPGHSLKTAVGAEFPVDISGRIDQKAGENYYKFHVPTRQIVTLEAIVRRMGSPLEAMLTLYNAGGAGLQSADSASGTDAVISSELAPGDYLVSIRDLYFGGGPRCAYRLQIRPGTLTGPGAQDFAVRFLPDAPRISRGGNTVVFVDLQRKGDFAGDVTVALDNLPPGVTCPPLVMNDKLPGVSGVLTFSAAADATLGSFPVRLRAVAMIGSSPVIHEGAAVLDGRPVEQAYLSVLDAAPVAIEPVASLTEQRARQLSAEADALAAKLAVPDPQLQAAQAAWEKKLADPVAWKVLSGAKITALSGTEFSTLPDDSVLAANPSPERDTYTVKAETNLAGITAIRLEALTDPSLPAKGPGRAIDGNFVLSQLSLTVAPKSAPAKAAAVVLQNPVADVEETGFPVLDAINAKPGKGWGIPPHKGEPTQAVFFLAAPIGDSKGSVLTFTLDQQFGRQHTLGCFRLSVTNDPQAASKASVPSKILKLVAKPAAERSAAEKAQITAYYKTIDPQVAVDMARLAALRSEAGVRIEIARLEALLTTNTPEFNKQKDEWEKSVVAGSGWLPLELTSVKSESGATLTKQPDDSVLAGGVSPATDVYTLVGSTALKGITAIRIEALPDPRFPASGPGRAPDGNFTLTKVLVFASPKETAEPKAMQGDQGKTPVALSDTTKPQGVKADQVKTQAVQDDSAKPQAAHGDRDKSPVEFEFAHATVEQTGHTAASILTGTKDAGWGVLPSVGRPAVATFLAKEKFGATDASVLTIRLEQKASSPQHTLGRFRIWVTSNPNPDAAVTLPVEIMAALKKTPDKRTDSQKKDLTTYFQTTAPALEPLRYRLAELKGETENELVVSRGAKFSIPFLLKRSNFKGGVKITIEGIVATRDPLTGMPVPLSKLLKFETLDLPVDKSAGSIDVNVIGQTVAGPRLGVLRVEAGTGDDMRVEYSAPFVLTLTGK